MENKLKQYKTKMDNLTDQIFNSIQQISVPRINFYNLPVMLGYEHGVTFPPTIRITKKYKGIKKVMHTIKYPKEICLLEWTV